MAKGKDLVPFIPPTEEEIMLIQPNNVTFGQYNISEWQENLLTLISDKLQKHMSREEELPRDLFNQPYVTIKCDEAGGKNHKTMVLKEALDLTKKIFSFRWVHPKIHKTIETTGAIITTIHNIKGTNQVMLNINPWAIPFLIYYGVGVGGTRYSKGLALGLRGNYTKRLYKIICSQRDRKQYYYPILQLRKDLEIPEVYSNAQIDQKILRPANSLRILRSHNNFRKFTRYLSACPPKASSIILSLSSSGIAGSPSNFRYPGFSRKICLTAIICSMICPSSFSSAARSYRLPPYTLAVFVMMPHLHSQ